MSILKNCKKALLKQKGKEDVDRCIELKLSRLKMLEFINEVNNTTEIVSPNSNNNLVGFHFNNVFICGFGFIKFEHDKELKEGYEIKEI